jgi:hypothetical protein
MNTCPPPTPDPCQQVCPPPPPAPPCRVKPIMRGLHWAQTKSILCQGFALSFATGFLLYVLVAWPRQAAYKDFYALVPMFMCLEGRVFVN